MPSAHAGLSVRQTVTPNRRTELPRRSYRTSTTRMLDPDYSWLLNCNVGQQFADHTLDVSLPSCPDSTYTLAGLDLHSTAETETSSPFATAAVDPSQPPLWSETYPFPVSQDISSPLFSLDPNFSVIDSTPAFLAADQDPTLLSACQGDNLFPAQYDAVTTQAS